MDFDLNKCINFISANTVKKISESFERWLSDDLTRIQWIALYFISTTERLSQRDLSKLMQINDSSALRLVDRLERDGLVLRQRNPKDRRVVALVLSEKGKKLSEKVMPIGSLFSDQMTKGISDEELEIFQRVQQKMHDNIINDERSKK